MTTDVLDGELPDLSSALARGTGPLWQRLKAFAPEHRVAEFNGAAVLLRHEDARAVLGSSAFHQGIVPDLERAGIDPAYVDRRRQTFLTMDGPDHARIGKLIAPAFRRAAVERFRPLIRRTMTGLLDAVLDGGACDAVASLTDPFPIPVICALLGVPDEDLALYSEAAALSTAAFFDPTAIPAALEVLGRMDEHLAHLVEREGADDLLGDLVRAEQDGERLSHRELVYNAGALIIAGTDTTRNQLANTLYALATRPDVWARLRQDPALLERAVEEAARWCPAIPFLRRIAVEDTTVRGLRFPAGTRVVLAVPSVNRDPDAFPEPDEFDLDRPRERPNLTFGAGAHFCSGAALGRAELHEGLAVLVRRLEEVHPTGDPVWRPLLGFQGPAELPLGFTAAKG